MFLSASFRRISDPPSRSRSRVGMRLGEERWQRIANDCPLVMVSAAVRTKADRTVSIEPGISVAGVAYATPKTLATVCAANGASVIPFIMILPAVFFIVKFRKPARRKANLKSSTSRCSSVRRTGVLFKTNSAEETRTTCSSELPLTSIARNERDNVELKLVRGRKKRTGIGFSILPNPFRRQAVRAVWLALYLLSQRPRRQF